MSTRVLTKLILTVVLISMIAGCCESHKAANNRIRLEHLAINVPDPVAMAQWYRDNLDMKIMREGPAPVNMRFIADADKNMMMELYSNADGPTPDYKSMNPLQLHIAFMVDDVDAIQAKLLAAGATVAKPIEVTAAGDKLVILKDPWGVSIQFLTRAKPMLE